MRRFRPLVFTALAIPALTAVFATLGAASLLSMLHMPRRTAEPPLDAQAAAIEAADGVTLRASWLRPAPAERCVLFLHGVGGTRDRVNRFVPMLRSGGYAILAPDSRAHGESGGDTITYGLLEKHDAVGWAHWMREQGCAEIYGLGESLGASVLIEAAAVEPVFSAIAADSPFADLLDEAEHRAGRMFPAPRFLAAPAAKLAVIGGSLYSRLALHIDFAQVSPVRSIVKSKTPVLLIHGTEDNRTPPEHSERLATANPATTKMWLVPGAGHVRAFRVAEGEYKRRVLDWYDRGR